MSLFKKMAKSTFDRHCHPVTPNAVEFCNILSEIRAIPEPTIESLTSKSNNVVTLKMYYDTFNKATDDFFETDPVVNNLGLELKDYNVFAGALPYEMNGVFSLPNWTFGLRAFAPQLFSLVLGIKVMRSYC